MTDSELEAIVDTMLNNVQLHTPAELWTSKDSKVTVHLRCEPRYSRDDRAVALESQPRLSSTPEPAGTGRRRRQAGQGVKGGLRIVRFTEGMRITQNTGDRRRPSL